MILFCKWNKLFIWKMVDQLSIHAREIVMMYADIHCWMLRIFSWETQKNFGFLRGRQADLLEERKFFMAEPLFLKAQMHDKIDVYKRQH